MTKRPTAPTPTTPTTTNKRSKVDVDPSSYAPMTSDEYLTWARAALKKNTPNFESLTPEEKKQFEATLSLNIRSGHLYNPERNMWYVETRAESLAAYRKDRPLPEFNEYEAYAPKPNKGAERLPAVAIDWECASGEIQAWHPQQVIDFNRLIAMDALTGSVLLDFIVATKDGAIDASHPSREDDFIKNKLAVHKASGIELLSAEQAREQLFKFVDADTVLFGREVRRCLDVLRLSHGRVVDAGVLERPVRDNLRFVGEGWKGKEKE